MHTETLTGRDLLDHTWWSMLELRAGASPERIAMQFEGVDWSTALDYASWHRLSRGVAEALAERGVGVGDTVAALNSGSAMWPVVQTACNLLGAVLVPVNSRYRRDELTFVLGLTQPKVVVFIERIRDESIVDRLRPALADAGADRPMLVTLPAPAIALDIAPARTEWSADEAGGGAVVDWSRFLAYGLALADARAEPRQIPVGPHDAVLMQFTSGTTAFPKGALLGSDSTLRATYELGRRMGLTDADVMYSTQPFYHVGGSVATTLMALTIDCMMVSPERYSPEETFRIIAKHGVTARTGQAAMYSMEMAHPDFDPEVFRTVTKGWSGGTAELKRSIIDTMGIHDLVSMYGLTEAAASTMVADRSDPLDVRIASSGRVLPDIELALCVDGRLTTDPDVVGEICIRGWPLMLGYYRNPEATEAAIDADGWLHTGDLASLDAGGNLYFQDRIKEMLKPGGENVSPAEIERVIAELAGVSQVAVVGRPDERLGEVPVAFVETLAGATLTEDEIIGRCAEAMASFKVPRSVLFVTEWPMTESGKILKTELKKRFADAGASLVGPTG